MPTANKKLLPQFLRLLSGAAVVLAVTGCVWARTVTVSAEMGAATTGAVSAVTESAAEIGFVSVAHGVRGDGAAAGGLQVFTDAAQWARRQRALHFLDDGLTINFDRDMLLLVRMGMRRSGGYGIEIVKVTETARAIQAHIVRTSPAAGSIVSQALTYPYHLVKLPRRDKPVTAIYSPAAE